MSMPSLRHHLSLLAAVLCLLAAAIHPLRAETALPGGEGGAQPDGVFPRQLRHPFGETRIPSAPSRIVVLSTGQIDAALTLGVVPVGATRVEGRGLYGAYLADAFASQRAKLDAMADLGGRASPDVEAIAQLHPDLILMNAALLKRDLYERLSRIAPTVVTHGTGVNWQVDFLLLADALGKRGTAEAFLDRFHADARADAVRWRDHPPAVSFLMSLAGRTRVFGVSSFAGGIAQELGLVRPADQRFSETSQDISAELLDRADADWIFFAGRGGAREGVAASPLWPTLNAVRARHAVAVDLDAFYLNAGPTAARHVLDTVASAIGR
ncbi:iron-siderophore ABC transporter substrate-binding protein [Telmatospirillum siberiense]|nr:ABC transporter substrate-binding protein [Telmatospirillum siberiense]